MSLKPGFNALCMKHMLARQRHQLAGLIESIQTYHTLCGVLEVCFRQVVGEDVHVTRRGEAAVVVVHLHLPSFASAAFDKEPAPQHQTTHAQQSTRCDCDSCSPPTRR